MPFRYPEDGRRRQDTVPITTRQLEALIRLSQARAKACLREFVLGRTHVVFLVAKIIPIVVPLSLILLSCFSRGGRHGCC